MLMAVFFFAACSGDGCGDCGGCGGFEERPYPPEFYPQTVETSGQVRVTPTGLGFIEDNILTLLEGGLPDGLNFCLPAQDGDTEVCNEGSVCDSGEAGCQIELELEETTITPNPTDTIDISVTIGGLDETIPVTFSVLGSDVSCDVQPHLRGDRDQPARITADVPITFTVEPASPTGDVRITVGELDPDLSELDFRLSGGFRCTLANAASRINFVRNLLLGQITDPLQEAVDDITREQLCQQCDEAGQCPNSTTCNAEDNVCDQADGQCVPITLGMEGRFLLGDALSDFTEHPESAMDLMLKVADHAEVNDGITLGLRSGYQPDAIRRCVPVDPTARPDFNAIPLSPAIVGNTRPDDSPFMIGVGYHKKAIQHALWSVWSSGATCLGLDSEGIEQVNSGIFLALFPSLGDIVESGSEAALKIVPQNAPDVILGENTVVESGSSYDIVDPLLTIDWKDLDIHIFIWGQEREIRIARLRVDVIVPVALTVDNGELIPVIGDLGDAIQNIRPFDTELASDDPAALVDLVPTLVGAALPSLAGDLVDPIELPEFLGLRLDLDSDGITSVDNETMIALYASLEPVSSPQVHSPNFGIASQRLDTSNVLPSGVVRPAVDLEMQHLAIPGLAEPTSDLEIEYSYRVNGGWWSLYDRSSALRVETPTLTLPGRHTIEVRARYKGMESTASAPVYTEVWVDWDVPTIEDVKVTQSGLSVEAHDLAEPAESLEYRFRVVAEEHANGWTEWSNQNTYEWARNLPEYVRVDVQVRDRVGHVGDFSRTVRRAALESAPQPGTAGERSARTGCSSTAQGPGALPVILMVLAMGLFWRRRSSRRFGSAVVVASLLALAGCSSDDESATTTCEPACTAGTYCSDGVCQAGCGSDDDCPDGTCEDNRCVTSCEATCDAQCGDAEFGTCDADGDCTCTPYCEEGCDEGEYCCQADNACQSLPDPCSDQMCEPGFEPAVVTAASGVAETCEVTEGECDCVSLPPLEIGLVGPYLDIDSNAGITAMTAFNATYKDFMFGIVDGESIAWTFADGVPAEGMIGGDLKGPRGGISSGGPAVGTHTAVVVDDSGVAHAFYHDLDNKTLKYARVTDVTGEANFEIATLDDTSGAGLWTDAILHEGLIHLIYMVDNVDDPDGTYESQVRSATFDPSASVAAIELSPEVILTGPSSHACGDSCERSERCLAQTGECATRTRDCDDSCGDGTVCVMGSCEQEFLSGLKSRALTTGQHLELSTTPDGLLLTFYDHVQASIGWMRYTDSWSMPQYAGTPSGPYGTGYVDSNDELHVAYMDTQNKTLVYENIAQGTVETVVEGVRDQPGLWLVHTIGEDVTMRVDSNGAVILVYQDAVLHELHEAFRQPDGTWDLTALASSDPFTGSHGFFATMLKVSDASLVAHWSIDQQQEPRVTVPVVLRP